MLMKSTDVSDLVGDLKKLEMRVNVLSSENEALRGKLDELYSRMDRLAKSFINTTGAMNDLIGTLVVYRRESSERLDIIEMNLFPKTADALTDAEKIIGKGDGLFFNPLDRREKP